MVDLAIAGVSCELPNILLLGLSLVEVRRNSNVLNLHYIEILKDYKELRLYILFFLVKVLVHQNYLYI